jgi:hypothetical protein
MAAECEGNQRPAFMTGSVRSWTVLKTWSIGGISDSIGLDGFGAKAPRPNRARMARRRQCLTRARIFDFALLAPPHRSIAVSASSADGGHRCGWTILLTS